MLHSLISVWNSVFLLLICTLCCFRSQFCRQFGSSFTFILKNLVDHTGECIIWVINTLCGLSEKNLDISTVLINFFVPNSSGPIHLLIFFVLYPRVTTQRVFILLPCDLPHHIDHIDRLIFSYHLLQSQFLTSFTFGFSGFIDLLLSFFLISRYLSQIYELLPMKPTNDFDD